MNNQTIEPEIKPCPLCGEEAESHSDFTAGIYTHNCANTKCELYDVPIPKAAWNRLFCLAEQERWIPVEEPPEMGTRCLLANGENACIATYMGKAVGGAEWKLETTGFHGEIYYASEPKIWQPLPLPPSKG